MTAKAISRPSSQRGPPPARPEKRPSPQAVEAPPQSTHAKIRCPRRAGHGAPERLAPPTEAPLQHQPHHSDRPGRPRPSLRVSVRLEKAHCGRRRLDRGVVLARAGVIRARRPRPSPTGSGEVDPPPPARRTQLAVPPGPVLHRPTSAQAGTFPRSRHPGHHGGLRTKSMWQSPVTDAKHRSHHAHVGTRRSIR